MCDISSGVSTCLNIFMKIIIIITIYQHIKTIKSTCLYIYIYVYKNKDRNSLHIKTITSNKINIFSF